MNKIKTTCLLMNNKKILDTIRGYADGIISHTYLIFHITALCLDNEKILKETDDLSVQRMD